MPYYKDTNNQLYFLDSVEFEYLLPADCVEITDEEAKEIEESNKPIPTTKQNKATASALLTATDWTTIVDVADPVNSPYLGNQAEFIAYRGLIRQIAVYPTAGDLIWPVAPNEVWL